jgi:predicted dehydrogenase
MDKKILKDSPKIAIIGCGAITELFYLPAIRKYPPILDQLFLIDTNQQRAQILASDFGARHYANDYHRIVEDIDGVIVATPPGTHYRICMDFLQMGVHVLCEKPLSVSPAEAEEMVAQAEKSDVTLSVNNTRRLFPSYKKVKEILQDGTLGSLSVLQYFEGKQFSWPAVSGFRFNSKGTPQGVLSDIGAHVLDAINWWIGQKPEIISAEYDSFGGDEGVALVKLRSNNCDIEVKLSWLNELINRFKIIGTAGTIEGETERWESLELHLKADKKRKVLLDAEIEDYNDFAEGLILNFIEIIANDAKPLIPAKNVLPSIELINDCYNCATKFNMPWYDDFRKIDGK